jgi:predicted ester cyclase
MSARRCSRAVLWICVVAFLAACASRDSSTEIVRRYLDELLVAQRWQKWDELMAASPTYNGVAAGRAAFEGVAGFLNATFSDLSLTVEDQRVDGAWVVTRLTVRGTQTGPFLNVPARHRPVRFNAILMDRLEGGRVVEMWHQFDYYDALLQVARP